MLRPEDYLSYRETAVAILGRHDGATAVEAFGLDDLFDDSTATTDLTPAFAFLEAQGYHGAVTPALGLVGLVACSSPGGPRMLLGSRVGAGRLVGVPGMTASTVVAVDRAGTGLVALDDASSLVRAQAAPVADDYLTILDADKADATTVVAEDELNGRRAAMLAHTQLGASAEILGVVDRLLEDAVVYAQQRRQFGRAVASYQSMQHLLAWAATERHELVSLLDVAVAQSAGGTVDPQLARAVKAMAGRVLHAVVQTAIQVIGGISFTWEYSLNRFHRRGLALDQLAGASADLIAAMGRQVRTEGVVPGLFELADVTN